MKAGGQTAVGAFVLGGVILGVSAFVLFGKLHIFSPVKHAAVVFQDSIAGLSVGSPVTFRGVRVGAVDSIAIQFDAKMHIAYIPVIVQLQPGLVRLTHGGDSEAVELKSLIAQGLRAELNTQSFVTGQSEIDLDFKPATTAVLHPDITDLVEIPTQQSTIQKVKEQLSQLPLRELADNATATLQSLRSLSEKLNQGLPPLVASLKTASDHSDVALSAAAQAIKDLQARLDVTLGNIDRLAVSGDRQLTQRGTELHTLLAASATTASRATEALSQLKSLTSDRGAARINIESALRDLAAATASLRGFASDVEHNPQLLLTGRKP
jgi:paraquat-inducible protein B